MISNRRARGGLRTVQGGAPRWRRRPAALRSGHRPPPRQGDL